MHASLETMIRRYNQHWKWLVLLLILIYVNGQNELIHRITLEKFDTIMCQANRKLADCYIHESIRLNLGRRNLRKDLENGKCEFQFTESRNTMKGEFFCYCSENPKDNTTAIMSLLFVNDHEDLYTYVGIAIACFVFLIVILIVVIVLRKRRKYCFEGSDSDSEYDEINLRMSQRPPFPPPRRFDNNPRNLHFMVSGMCSDGYINPITLRNPNFHSTEIGQKQSGPEVNKQQPISIFDAPATENKLKGELRAIAQKASDPMSVKGSLCVKNQYTTQRSLSEEIKVLTEKMNTLAEPEVNEYVDMSKGPGKPPKYVSLIDPLSEKNHRTNGDHPMYDD